jgi:PEP-CTERM motif
MKLFRLMGLFVGMVSAATTQAGFIFEVDPLTSVQLGNTLSTSLYVTATTPADVAAMASLSSMSFNLSGTGGTATISSWTKNPSFNLGAASGVPAGATLNQGLTLSLVGVPAVAGRVKLGDINFLGNSVGDTVFRFEDPNPAPTENVTYLTTTGTAVSLDSQVFTGASNFTVNVTAVPEPSTFALIGLVGSGAFAWRRFRVKKTS